MKDAQLDKVMREIRLRKIQERKRLYEQAKRARKASGTPMAERADLKSVQCEFESRAEDQHALSNGFSREVSTLAVSVRL